MHTQRTQKFNLPRGLHKTRAVSSAEGRFFLFFFIIIYCEKSFRERNVFKSKPTNLDSMKYLSPLGILKNTLLPKFIVTHYINKKYLPTVVSIFFQNERTYVYTVYRNNVCMNDVWKIKKKNNLLNTKRVSNRPASHLISFSRAKKCATSRSFRLSVRGK